MEKRYETKLLNRISIAIRNGKIAQAKNLYNIARKIENQFNTIKLEVYNAHYKRLYGDNKPYYISKEACYWEDKILARQDIEF